MTQSNLATVTITVNATATDTVTILKANYNWKKDELSVDASSSAGGSVTLTAEALDSSGSVLKTIILQFNAKQGKHKGKITGLSSKPFTVRVTSNLGGEDSVGQSGIGGKGG